jgi:hypothetical protein
MVQRTQMETERRMAEMGFQGSCAHPALRDKTHHHGQTRIHVWRTLSVNRPNRQDRHAFRRREGLETQRKGGSHVARPRA